MVEVLISNAVLISVVMLAVWLTSLVLRDASIIDPVWGLGFVFVAWNTWRVSGDFNYSAVVPLLTTVWGLRLSGYLAWRGFGEGEDFRYQAMREKHGINFWWVSLITVFVLQGFLMWLVALPIQLISGPPGNMPLFVLGVAVWMIGFLFESVGDWQLARFQAHPENRGKVLSSGLWKYTRHPNYFGDFCVWWGLFLVSCSAGAPVLVVASPVLMSILLMRVSGVTLLEKTLVNRKPEYAEYIDRTSAFFPDASSITVLWRNSFEFID